jgi:hypothetical protein
MYCISASCSGQTCCCSGPTGGVPKTLRPCAGAPATAAASDGVRIDLRARFARPAHAGSGRPERRPTANWSSPGSWTCPRDRGLQPGRGSREWTWRSQRSYVEQYRAHARASTAVTTVSAQSSSSRLISKSQNRSTCQPRAARATSAARSRAILRAIFSSQ